MIDPDDEETLLGYEENMRRLEAKRSMRELKYRPDVRLSAEAVYDLVLQATDDEESAREAMKAIIHARLRAGQVPE